MRTLLYLPLVLIYFSLTANAQMNDPFAASSSTTAESAFSSPGELPEFKSFVTGLDMENIKITPIEPFDLKSLMETRNRMFIIDTREQNEFDISHIQGAKRVGYTYFTVERVWMLDRNTTIILYSTDGTRSAHVGAYMKMMGFIDVRMIHGSIIGWVNAGYTLVDKDGHATTNIFVHDKEEAKKMKKGKAILPAE